MRCCGLGEGARADVVPGARWGLGGGEKELGAGVREAGGEGGGEGKKNSGDVSSDTKTSMHENLKEKDRG